MRRSRENNHINRNNNTKVNHIRRNDVSCDPITPEIVVGQIWLQDGTDTEGVQIKELNSSNTDGSAESLELEDRYYPCFYNNHERLQRLEEHFRINRKARELRRERIANQNTPKQTTDVGENYALEDLYINLTSNTDIPGNHAVNCFTILNKHIMNSSDTSSDTDYEDVDIFTPRDSLQGLNDKDFENEIVSYDPEQCSEKRTIWIYSFKNKRLLSENDFELVNIPSNNNTSESSTSIEKIEENALRDKPETMRRVSSPFPAPFVPKLNLTKGPTLSTLTEVTEPNKPSSSVSNETEKTFEEKFFKRKHNGWFINDNKDSGDEKMVKKQNSNVINWMALSPRERRRKFRTITVDANLPTVSETNSRVEVEPKNENADDSVLPELANVVVNVVVHTIDEDGDIKSTISPKNNWLDEFNTKDKVSKNIITSEEVLEGNENDDRGDYKRKSFRKLHIKLDSKKIVNPIVSDPIEKLDGSSWIGEDDKASRIIRSDTEAVVRTEAFETEDQNSASRRLFARNLCLMKPALWQEYASITHSPISLHLSLNSLVDIKQSWYERLFKCFKWCKRN